MAVDKRDMFLGGAVGTGLSYAEGTVIPYNGYELPPTLAAPLIVDKNGQISAYLSGGRSSVVPVERKWFKKKGDRPKISEKWPSNEPYGGMSRVRASTELDFAKRIHERFKEFNCSGPMVPAALVEYEIPFNGSERVCSAILEIFGDTRVSQISARIVKANRKGKLLDRKYRDELMKELISWLGFSNRMMKDTGAFPSPSSHGLNNYVLYELHDGFGISRIDFGSCSQNNSRNFYHRVVLGELLSCELPFQNLSRIAQEFNLPFKQLLQQFEKGGIPIDTLDLRTVKTIQADVVRSCENIYYDFFDRGEVPRPIERKLIYKLFEAVQIPPTLNIFDQHI